MKLYYENQSGEHIYIGDFKTLEDAEQNIITFWNSIGVEIYCISSVYKEDEIWIDFGSHSCFYHLKKENENESII